MTNSLHHQAELLEERLGLKIAARLSEAGDALPHDITQRLRHARKQALARRKQPQSEAAMVLLPSGAGAALGGSAGPGSTWWQRIGVLLPVLALLIGLMAIDRVMDDKAAREMAKVDAALLLDDLPPAAYSDPGFLQYLRAYRDTAR